MALDAAAKRKRPNPCEYRDEPKLFTDAESPLFGRTLVDCMPDGGIIGGLMLAHLVREAGLAVDPRLTLWAEGAVRIALTGLNRRHLDALDERQWQIIADLSRRDFPELAAAWRQAGLPVDMGLRRTLVVRHRGRL